jgi:hypothetical protein
MQNAFSSHTTHLNDMSSSNSSRIHSNTQLIQEYISTLTPFEQQGLAIAMEHLGPSFDMKRSSGFLRWKDSRQPTKTTGK